VVARYFPEEKEEHKRRGPRGVCAVLGGGCLGGRTAQSEGRIGALPWPSVLAKPTLLYSLGHINDHRE
jgi:hypothetical protein